MALGDQIRQRREEKGISAADLARRAGLSKGYLSELESGGAESGNARPPRPSAEILYRIATELGTTIADLLEKEIQPAPTAIPPGLQEFAAKSNIPEEDVKMLAQIRFRGNQPSSVEDWQFLYESIKRSIRGNQGR